MVEKKISVKMQDFIALTKLHHAGFIDDEGLKIAVEKKKISIETLVQALTQDKISYLCEGAAIVLSDVDKPGITAAFISAALPGESEVQKRIAQMAKKRPDYAETLKRFLEF